MKSKLKYLLIIMILAIFTGCGSFKEYTKTFEVFDKNIKVTVYTTNEKKAKKALSNIKEIYNNYENLLNELNQANNDTKDNKISKELEEVINYGISWYEKSDKYLNINTNLLSQAWDEYYYNNKSFVLEKIDVNIKNAIIKNDVLSKKANINIDFYIKGYATDKVYEYLKEQGISRFFINVGGSVLAGDTLNKDFYTVGISSPFDSSVIKMLKLKNKYVVTKSIYEDYYEQDGKIYSKFINGKTLMPSDENISVTVITDSASEGDMLASVLFLMPIEEGKKFIKDYDAEVIWCYNDNGVEKIEYTDNINSY